MPTLHEPPPHTTPHHTINLIQFKHIEQREKADLTFDWGLIEMEARHRVLKSAESKYRFPGASHSTKQSPQLFSNSSGPLLKRVKSIPEGHMASTHHNTHNTQNIHRRLSGDDPKTHNDAADDDDDNLLTVRSLSVDNVNVRALKEGVDISAGPTSPSVSTDRKVQSPRTYFKNFKKMTLSMSSSAIPVRGESSHDRAKTTTSPRHSAGVVVPPSGSGGDGGSPAQPPKLPRVSPRSRGKIAGILGIDVDSWPAEKKRKPEEPKSNGASVGGKEETETQQQKGKEKENEQAKEQEKEKVEKEKPVEVKEKEKGKEKERPREPDSPTEGSSPPHQSGNGGGGVHDFGPASSALITPRGHKHSPPSPPSSSQTLSAPGAGSAVPSQVFSPFHKSSIFPVFSIDNCRTSGPFPRRSSSFYGYSTSAGANSYPVSAYETPPPTFSEIFVLTYRTVLSPHQLIKAMLKR